MFAPGKKKRVYKLVSGNPSHTSTAPKSALDLFANSRKKHTNLNQNIMSKSSTFPPLNGNITIRQPRNVKGSITGANKGATAGRSGKGANSVKNYKK